MLTWKAFWKIKINTAGTSAVSFFFPLRDFLFVGWTFPIAKKKGLLATEYFTFHQAEVLTKLPAIPRKRTTMTMTSVTCTEADWLELIKVQVGGGANQPTVDLALNL